LERVQKGQNRNLIKRALKEDRHGKGSKKLKQATRICLCTCEGYEFAAMEGRPSPSSLPAVVVLSLDSRKEGRGSGDAKLQARKDFCS